MVRRRVNHGVPGLGGRRSAVMMGWVDGWRVPKCKIASREAVRVPVKGLGTVGGRV
jgi:hypothetical protein